MTAILLHAHTKMRDRYEKALGQPVTIVNSRGSQLSSGYDERSGFAAKPLPVFLAEHAPEHRDGTPLVLMGFSAGCFAIRHWLRDAQNRRDVTAAVFIDGLHGDDESKLGGVLEYARLVQSESRRRRLIITHSAIKPPTYPSTTDAADWLLAKLGMQRRNGRNGVIVLGYGGADGAAHEDQIQTIGPRAVRDHLRILAPKLLDDRMPDTEPAPPPSDARPLRLRALDRCLEEARRYGDGQVPTSRIALYMSGCERDGRPLGLGGGRRWNYCAGSQGYVEHDVAAPDEQPPPWRAAAKEIKRDAEASDRRGWHPREKLASGWRPPPGALAIYHRGPPGAWTGHVDRVIEVEGDGYRNVGGNEAGGRWRIEWSPFDNPALLGFVVDDDPTEPVVSDDVIPEDAVEPELTEQDRRQTRGQIAITQDGQVQELRRSNYGR